jgi:hypothetical protein
VKPFLAVSFSRKSFSPHLNVAYQWNGDSVLAGNVITGTKADTPDQIHYVAGFDVGLTSRITLALDVLGRHVIDSPRLVATTFNALDGTTTFPNITFKEKASFDMLDGAAGLKVNLGGRLLAGLNVLFKLNSAGLRDAITPLFGFEYDF